MRLRVSNYEQFDYLEEKSEQEKKIHHRNGQILVSEFVRTWTDLMRREIDSEIRVETAFPYGTAVSLPEGEFSFVLTALYRFFVLSPRLGDPRVLFSTEGNKLTVSVIAPKRGDGDLPDHTTLDVPEHYLRILSQRISACGADWRIERTGDEFRIVLLAEAAPYTYGRLRALTPDGVAGGVRLGLEEVDRVKEVS